MKTIAIDPGASGGIAWQDDDGQVHCTSMPATEGDVLELLRGIGFVNSRFIIEEVGGFIKGNPAPGSTMFNFGRGYGFIIGLAMAYYCELELCRPQKWQKHFGLGTSASAGGKTEWKNKLKAKAQQLYPFKEVTLKTADALLILNYKLNQ